MKFICATPASLACLVVLSLSDFSGQKNRAAEQPPNPYQALRIKAEQGDAQAQYKLGDSYFIGESFVIADEVEAVAWFHKAAKQGLVEAQHALGELYSSAILSGGYPPKDDAEAAKWFRSAAEKGHADSQYWFGQITSRGLGVLKDDVEGLNWFRKAAAQGHADAHFSIASCYRQGRGGVQQNLAEANSWQQKGHALRMVEQQRQLSRGKPKDQNVGLENYYRLAAWQGDPPAQYVFGKMLADGQGMVKNSVEAYRWWLLAASQDHVKAKAKIANIEKTLSAPQRAEGQRRAREFKPVKR